MGSKPHTRPSTLLGARLSKGRPRAIAVLALGYLAGLIAYPALPGPFLAQSTPARWLVAFTLPTAALVIDTLFRSLWKHDGIRAGNGAFAATYDAIVFRVLLFVLALQLLVMIELTDVVRAEIRLATARVVVVLLGLALASIGNLLPRTRPNVAVGFRTKRTLTDAALWGQLHRIGGYVTVGLGIAIGAMALVLSRQGLGAAIGTAAMLSITVVIVTYWRLARA
jgi:hypothetical protein